MGEDEPRVGELAGQLRRRGRPSAGIPRPAWIRIGSSRSSAIAASSRTAGWSSVNCSARGCSLIPLAPAASARSASARRRRRCGLTRQNGVSRPSEPRGRLDHHVVGRRVAVGLVHREHERARARRRRRSTASSSCGRLLHPVGVVLTQVRVGVEQLHAGDLLAQQLGPRGDHRGDVHALHSYHESVDDPAAETLEPAAGAGRRRRRRDRSPTPGRSAACRSPTASCWRRWPGSATGSCGCRPSATAPAWSSRRWSRASPSTTATSAPARELLRIHPDEHPGVGAAVRPRPRRDGVGRRARRRRRRRPDRHQHGLPGAEGVQDRRRRGAAGRPRARGRARAGGGARQRPAGDRQAALRAAAGRPQRDRGGPPAGRGRRRRRALHPSAPRVAAPRRRAGLRARPRAGRGAAGAGADLRRAAHAGAGARGVRAHRRRRGGAGPRVAGQPVAVRAAAGRARRTSRPRRRSSPSSTG